MAERFREDIINEDFIVRVLKHHRAGKEVELLEFSANAGTSKGDNYMGDLASVEVSAKIDGAPETFHWMVKLLKPDPPNGGKHIGRVMKVFQREINMYNKVLPALNKIGSIAHCPVIFADETDGQESLVLEHMKQHGWRDPLNKKAGLTLEHVKLVVEWMAHLHGLGHIMINQHPGGPEAWHRENPWSVSMAVDPPAIMAKFMAMMKDDQKKKFLRVAEILKEENPDSGFDYVKHVLAFFEKNIWVEDLRKKSQLTEGRPFTTICHLDPWFNNMLFHYGDNGDPHKPAKVLLLDFQLSAYTIPANDLTYFLLCSTTPSFRKEHLDSVLKHYHETLVRVVKDCGQSDFSYSFPELISDYELCLNIGPMLIMFALPMMLNIDPEDAVDFGGIDLLDEGSKVQLEKLNSANFEELIQRHPYLKDRVKGVFDDIIQANVF